MEFECKKSKANRFCILCLQFRILGILAGVQGFFFLKFFNLFTVANDIQFIGKGSVAWKGQGA